MRSVILRLLALMAFSIGVMIGLSLPKEAEATQYTYYVWNQPGTNSSSATLTCGWHNDCTYGSDGDALDWMNSSSVYWHSLSSNSQGISWVGRVYVADLSWGSCYRTYAEVRTPLGTSLEGILYRHTLSPPFLAPPHMSGVDCTPHQPHSSLAPLLPMTADTSRPTFIRREDPPTGRGTLTTRRERRATTTMVARPITYGVSTTPSVSGMPAATRQGRSRSAHS